MPLPASLPVIDWNLLRDSAIRVMERAHAPYSGYPVGAAGILDSGEIVTGCNVENISFGLTLCAECGLVSQAYARGNGTLVAVFVCDRDGTPILPCGRCRQVLLEAAGPALLVATESGPVALSVLLPQPFSPGSLSG